LSITDVTLRDVYLARHRIAPIVSKTPLVASPALSSHTGASIFLKLENLQHTGSFKLRGAANKTLSLTSEEQSRGVLTVSTGNHGRAVAYVARLLDINAVVCVSEHVPDVKVRALEESGAEVSVRGGSYDEAMAYATQLQDRRGLTWVDPFDDPYVIAGQGTVALEILDEKPNVDAVIVPLSGGGLFSGIAVAMKSIAPDIRMIGVSMDRSPVMYHSLIAGRPIEMTEQPTIADALAGGIYLDNRYTYRLVKQYADETYLVTEEEIADGMGFALNQHRLVVEGGGAVGIAAALHRELSITGQNVVIVISGSNVDPLLLAKIIQGEYRP
jgi:threonine dehydratase